DGVASATLIAENAVAAAFGPAEVGYTGRFAVARGAERFDVAVTKDWYDVRYVLAARALTEVDPAIGYVNLSGMAEPTRLEWSQALSALIGSGVRRLIVDLRENGGGRLTVAADVGSALAPDGAAGQVLVALGFNSRHRHANYEIRLGPNPHGQPFEQVVWITSGLSCSAAEMLINGLSPLRPSAIIGEPTCGKPVGFTPSTFGAKVLSAVSFAGANRDGIADFYSGLTPTCRISSDLYVAYGDPADPKLAEAIHRLQTGHCSAAAEPPPAAAAVEAKALARWPWQDEPGLARETGLR
ncbi:MAG TPA: S41 family peptidase, partial [Burkholderiaceae bacterium]|nr:S41 family peptidase [Burkholderiaceae bacterium]